MSLISHLTDDTIVIARQNFSESLVQQFRARYSDSEPFDWTEYPPGNWMDGSEDYDDLTELERDPNFPRGARYYGVRYNTVTADMARDASLISSYVQQRAVITREQWHAMMRQKLQERGYNV